MKIYLKRSIKAVTVIAIAVFMIVAVRFWYLEEQGNFHPVTSGEAYRSAQLDQDEFEYYIHKFGMRSVINLRGNNAGERWYEEEINTCQKLGTNHYDLGLSAGRKPSSGEIQALLNLFETAPRPVLIHCKAGADRSGLAAAIWLVVVDGKPKSESKKQLSIRYGHIPIGSTQVLDRFFEKWVWVGETKGKYSWALKS
jgi:protein tyrosine/serine phosphatase